MCTASEEERDPSAPHEWLRRARSNFARAASEPANPDILLEDLCFDAQQPAEKAIKAVLVQRAISFPKTHSIADLLSLAAENGVAVPPDVSVAADLTTYAVEALSRSFGKREPRGMDRGRRLGDGRPALGRGDGRGFW